MSSVIAFSILTPLSYLGVTLIRRYAERRQIIDHPNERSSHVIPTPRTRTGMNPRAMQTKPTKVG